MNEASARDLIAQVMNDSAATARELLLVDLLSSVMEEIDDLVDALHRLHAEIVTRGWDEDQLAAPPAV